MALPELVTAAISGNIVVLYDGRCGFCKKSIRMLRTLDVFHRLVFANYHDPMVRETYAPMIELQSLDQEMHALLPSGEYKKGFFAFRAIAWHLPLLWPLAPFLYLPGAAILGSKTYMLIADHR